MAQKIIIVTKSKRMYGNMLLFDESTSEYIYMHFGVERWRIKGVRKLLEDFPIMEYTEMNEKHPIFKKYCDSCENKEKLLSFNCRALLSK